MPSRCDSLDFGDLLISNDTPSVPPLYDPDILDCIAASIEEFQSVDMSSDNQSVSCGPIVTTPLVDSSMSDRVIVDSVHEEVSGNVSTMSIAGSSLEISQVPSKPASISQGLKNTVACGSSVKPCQCNLTVIVDSRCLVMNDTVIGQTLSCPLNCDIPISLCTRSPRGLRISLSKHGLKYHNFKITIVGNLVELFKK